MKRNPVIIRAILEYYRSNTEDGAKFISEKFNISEAEYTYHLWLLLDAELMALTKHGDFPRAITWKGHDYLESLS